MNLRIYLQQASHLHSRQSKCQIYHQLTRNGQQCAFVLCNKEKHVEPKLSTYRPVRFNQYHHYLIYCVSNNFTKDLKFSLEEIAY